MTKTYRNSTIDIYKGILIVLVLVTHYDWSDSWRHSPIFPFVIDMAIPCFMIITGYVYTISAKKHNVTSFKQAYNPKLIANRLLRYSIPYTCMVIWQILDRKIIIDIRGIDYLKWFLYGTDGKGTYYFPVMIQIVFLFPIIHSIVSKLGKKGLWICFAFNAIYELLTWSYGLGVETYRLLCFRYIFVIAVGVYVGEGNRFKLSQSILLTALGGLFIFSTNYLGYTPIILKMWTGTNLISCLLIAPIMVYAISKIHIRCAPLELIGRATYNIFLVQIIYYLAYCDYSKNYFSSWKIHLLFGIVVSLVIGVLFYLLESNVTRWISYRINLIIDKLDVQSGD